MKLFFKIIICFCCFFYTSNSYAQLFKVSISGQNSLTLGDFGKAEFKDPSASYAEYGSIGGLEFTFYPDNQFGIGFRWSNGTYGRNTGGFESDFLTEYNISDNNYSITQPYAYFTFGFETGASYIIELNDKWQIEPYFYFGFKVLTSQEISAIYIDNGNTFQYETDAPPFFGYSFSSGAKIQWNASKHFGIFLSGEYLFNSFIEDIEKRINYSASTLDIENFTRSFTISSFNLGLGVSYRFGKGLNKKE